MGPPLLNGGTGMATQPPAVPHCPLPPLPHRSDPLFGAAGAKDCGHWFVLPPRPSHPPPPAATQQHQQQQQRISPPSRWTSMHRRLSK
mmetsp:Transcript_11350/g.32930  ORF Transcript_11350/g.32930 Transcript_11350/m.32930 type:complete len:88 (+) Transcript_11350:1582-1845(+)